ncbi:MAG: ArgR family transcriptional regulator [Spirochaetales bacterium]|uniref:Arginine repressor n=1 Tax=Candidatus Thalassospirochaeta sargassi TaxID=3119039 RepID=A0AAJ1IEY0_9SPIO|nr:ArgR family transcriptional regulator [Spirochaetales bacterium]
MQRAERMEAVKRIIRENKISSQEQLLSELMKDGFDVTQATLSRDLKQLKVAKISDGHDGYMYSVPGYSAPRTESRVSSIYIDDLKRGFISISFSGNMGMIRTIVGHANSVAAAIDNLTIPGVLGTVAGDDTIFVLLNEGAKRNEIENFFRGIK